MLHGLKYKLWEFFLSRFVVLVGLISCNASYKSKRLFSFRLWKGQNLRKKKKQMFSYEHSESYYTHASVILRLWRTTKIYTDTLNIAKKWVRFKYYQFYFTMLYKELKPKISLILKSIISKEEGNQKQSLKNLDLMKATITKYKNKCAW